MDRERISRALERIEAAAERLERYAANPPVAVDRAETGPSDDTLEISEKYQQLRRETSAAIADLDGLIDRLSA